MLDSKMQKFLDFLDDAYRPRDEWAELKRRIIEKETGKQPRYFWIQFPAKTDTLPKVFEKQILELSKYNWFKQVTWNIEMHGEQTNHMHSHMIIENPKEQLRPARIIDQLSKHLGIPPNMIHCKRENHSFSNRLNYIKGLKVSPDKQILVEKDNQFREKNNLDIYYNAL